MHKVIKFTIKENILEYLSTNKSIVQFKLYNLNNSHSRYKGSWTHVKKMYEINKKKIILWLRIFNIVYLYINNLISK